MKHPHGVAAEAITGTERRGSWHISASKMLQRRILFLKDVLDLNRGREKKEMMNMFRENKMGSKREECRQQEGEEGARRSLGIGVIETGQRK